MYNIYRCNSHLSTYTPICQDENVFFPLQIYEITRRVYFLSKYHSRERMREE